MNLPNSITLIRIFLVPFFFTELVSYHRGADFHRWVALSLFAIASFTDALDGYLARVLSQRTELGKFLDPVADKLLLLSGYLGLSLVKDLLYTPPVWVTVTIVFRDLVILVGLFIMFLLTGKLNIQPNFLGKATTAAQMITLIFILLNWKYSYFLWTITAALSIISCAVYLVRDIKKLAL